jgi:hypothetical protein
MLIERLNCCTLQVLKVLTNNPAYFGRLGTAGILWSYKALAKV